MYPILVFNYSRSQHQSPNSGPFVTGVVVQVHLKVKFTPKILMKRKQFSLHPDLPPLKKHSDPTRQKTTSQC